MRKANFRQIGALEGSAVIRAGQSYTFRYRLEPYQSIDPHKCFFNIQDTVPIVGNRAAADITANRPYLVDGKKTQSFVRADNHFINAIGSFRILMNGTVVEEFTSGSNLGEIDCVLKRLNHSKFMNILKDHQNFGKDYSERYLDTKTNTQEYQVVPEFSKFWRMTDPILGGIELQIELTIHNQYENRCLDTNGGVLPWLKIDGTAAGTTYAATDKLSTLSTANVYSLNDIKLYLWVEDNINSAPLLKPHSYLHDTWRMERRPLQPSTDHQFEFFVRPNIKRFGFVFQHNSVDNNTNIGVTNFTGAPRYVRGNTFSGGLFDVAFRKEYFQSARLKSYEVEYNKNRLPYSYMDQNVNYGTLVDTTRKQSYIRSLNYVMSTILQELMNTPMKY